MLWMFLSIAALVLGAVALLASLRRASLERRVERKVRELWNGQGGGPAERRSPKGLPRPVRRYLKACGAAMRDPVRSARFQHGGTFRPGLDGKWFPVRGEQFLGADPPGFVWWGRIPVAPGFEMQASDLAVGGEGRMLVKVHSTLTLDDLRGPEVDQGELVRLLADMVWLPTALLDDRYFRWEAVDDTSARAILRLAGRDASVTFRFDRDGLPVGFEAERHRRVGARWVLTPWTGTWQDFREVGGLRLPFKNEVAWHLEDGAHPYVRWEIQDVEIDPAGEAAPAPAPEGGQGSRARSGAGARTRLRRTG